MRDPRLATLLAGALLLSACSTGDAGTPPAATDRLRLQPASTSSTPSTTVAESAGPPPPACPPRAGSVEDLPDTPDPTAVSVAVSRATFRCADAAVIALAGTTDAERAAVGAVESGGPLLLVTTGPTADLLEEIERLAPAVLILGRGVDPEWFAAFETRPLTGDAVPLGSSLSAPEPTRLWFVSGRTASSAWPSVWTAASLTGAASTLLPSPDLVAARAARERLLRDGATVPLSIIGFDPEIEWQLTALHAGFELPGGGLLLFPGRRLVALYGNPLTPLLGALGEQAPDEGVDRIRELAVDYAADGIPVVPTFEIIATVASAVPGDDGDYSEETDIEVIRPWVETARQRGAYVILDLQSGRTDFLTQAQRYEELLLEPHVGLALDPEWRLEPDQVHLRQIGRVDATEINAVAEWLATLVRDNALPQKLLVLHQFNLEMITGRDRIITPPELAVTIQMDGEGPPGAKQVTWDVLTDSDADRFWWGWKNFFDEDAPMPGPGFVLDREPTVHLVSFQ